MAKKKKSNQPAEQASDSKAKSSGKKKPSTAKPASTMELTTSEVKRLRLALGEEAARLTDGELRELATELASLTDGLGVQVNADILIEMAENLREDLLLATDEEKEEHEHHEPVELTEWEQFAADNFHPDFFDGAAALEDMDATADREHRYRQLEDLAEAYPQCGQIWIRLAALESSPAHARERLNQALENSSWLLALAEAYPQHAPDILHMYVMLGLDVAGEFWILGLRIDALEIQAKLLELDPNDTGGQRMIYAFRLFEQGWFEELTEQIEMLEKDTQSVAGLSLLKAFVAYVRDHDLLAADRFLHASYALNPLTFDTLLAGIDDDELDRYDQFSPEVEGRWLGRLAIASAVSIDGLGRWMRDTLEYSAPSDDADNGDDWKDRIVFLLNIDQGEDEWFVDSRRLDDGYITVVGDLSESNILAFDQQDTMPTSEELWTLVVDSMEYPEIGEKIRPRKLTVTAPGLAQEWSERCEVLEIDLEYHDNLELPDEVFDMVTSGISIVSHDVELDEETLEQAEQLPRSDETWVVGCFRPPIWIRDSATPRRAWLCLVLDADSGMVRMQDVVDEEPSKDFVAKTIAKALFMSMIPDAQASLPAEIQLQSELSDTALNQLCQRLAIPCKSCDDASILDFAIESIIEMASDPEFRPSMQESADLEIDELRTLYRDFALFYRAALWRSLPRHQILEIRSTLSQPKFFARLAGHFGEYRGVLVGYEVEDFVAIEQDNNDGKPVTSTLLGFDEDHTIPPLDLWIAEHHAFEIAGENAFPYVQHCSKEEGYRRPNRQEVLQLQIAIRSIMSLAERPQQGQIENLVVASIEGPIDVTARWIPIG